MNAVTPAMRARAIESWRADFARLRASSKSSVKLTLVFLPAWWPSADMAFAYFHCVFIGPGLLRAPNEVRAYLLAHELGHIQRAHTAGQVVYWLCVGLAVGLSAILPRPFAMMPLVLVLVGANAWILWGEKRREFEADDEAAAVCGDTAVIDGLMWMQNRRGGAKALDIERVARRRESLSQALSAKPQAQG